MRDLVSGGPSLVVENAERRAVEALAQALYEAEDPAGIAWVRRAGIVRDPLLRARQKLRAGA